MSTLQMKINKSKHEIDYYGEIMTDYYKNQTLNLDMLEDYISIVMNVQKKVDGIDYHINYKMKYCTPENFTRFGVDPPVNLEKEFLCPDILENDENYKVAGSISDKVNRTSFSL